MGYQIDLTNIPIEGKVQIGPLDLDEFTKSLPQIVKQIPPGIGLRSPLRLQADVTGAGKVLKLSNIDLRASIFGAKKTNLKVKGGEISPLGPKISPQDLKIKAHVELTPVILENVRRFTPLQKALPTQLKAAGPVSLRTDVSGSLQKFNVAASLEATRANMGLNKDLQKPVDIPLTISLKCQMVGQEITCQDFQFSLHQLEAKGSGKVIMGKIPSVDLTIKSSKADLAGWEQIVSTLKDYCLSGTLEAQTHITGSVGGEKSLTIQGKVDLTSINASLKLTGDTPELKETSLRWDSSPIKLGGKVQNFARPIFTYELFSPELKLADFLKL